MVTERSDSGGKGCHWRRIACCRGGSVEEALHIIKVGPIRLLLHHVLRPKMFKLFKDYENEVKGQ